MEGFAIKKRQFALVIPHSIARISSGIIWSEGLEYVYRFPRTETYIALSHFSFELLQGAHDSSTLVRFGAEASLAAVAMPSFGEKEA